MEPISEKSPGNQAPQRMSENDRLRLENTVLRRALLEHGIRVPSLEPCSPEDPFPPSSHREGVVSAISAAHEKISLFRRLFRGREDVYALRWTGRDGKISYPTSQPD